LFELYTAKKHLTARRRQTLLAVGAVALAVTITILFRSLINGFEGTINDIIFQFVPHVTVLPKDRRRAGYPSIRPSSMPSGRSRG